MQNNLFSYNIKGRYINISRIDFPLSKLQEIFEQKDLYYIFGKRIYENSFLDEIENDTWSTHLIFKLNKTQKIVGYLRIIRVKGIIEIHGGGLNKTVIEKIALTEAWILIIQYCFDCFKIAKINTSCMINNAPAYKFITGTGFRKISIEYEVNRINFEIDKLEFQNNLIQQRLTKPCW